MNRLRYMLTDSRTLAILGIAIMAGLFFLGPNTLKMLAFWIGIGLLALLLVLIGLWIAHHMRARRQSEQLGDALLKPSTTPGQSSARNADVEALHERLRDAVKTIKTSRLGQTRGTEALYELP